MISEDDLRKAKNRERMRRWREKNKDNPEYKARVRANARKQREKDPDKSRAAKRADYRKNAKAISERSKQKRLIDGDAVRAKRREYTKTEKYRAYRAEYNKRPEVRARRLERESTPEARAKQAEKNRRADKDKARAAVRRWQRENLEYHRIANRRRSAMRRGALGSHTEEQWERMVSAFGGCCAYCLGEGPLTRDHIVPLTRGGTEFITNILPACWSCNSAKGNRIMPDQLEDWVAMRRAIRRAERALA